MEKTIKLFLLVMIPALFSCSMHISATSYQDRTIPPIPLSDVPSTAVWKSSDLSITIKQNHQQDSITFTGQVTFGNSIRLSFPVIEQFSLALLIQDRHGTVLKREFLRLGIIHYQFVEDSYRFKLQTKMPENAVRYTFEYDGSFSDYGEIRPGSIYIAYHPQQPSVKSAEQ